MIRVGTMTCEEGSQMCTNEDVQMVVHPVSYEEGNRSDWVAMCDSCHEFVSDEV